MTSKDEQNLERLAGQLGGRAAERLDVERVANEVLSRLRAQPAERHVWRRRPVWLRIAAAIALVVGGILAIRARLDPADRGPAAMIPHLTELAPDQLLEIADSVHFDTPLHENVAVGLHDLTEEQLRELLRLMEG